MLLREITKSMKAEETETKNYLQSISLQVRRYLRDVINEHKAAIKLKNNKTQSGEWKIQLSMHVNFISSKDTGETRPIYEVVMQKL